MYWLDKLGRVGLGFLQLFDDHGQQQSLARAFDQYGLISEEEIAACQGQILVEKPPVISRRVAQPLAQVLDLGVANAIEGGREEIPDRFEAGGVGDVG